MPTAIALSISVCVKLLSKWREAGYVPLPACHSDPLSWSLPFSGGVGVGTSAFLAQPRDPHLCEWDRTRKSLVGKSCIWASISWADSPQGPCLAASVWPISWMKSWTKSWTGPASSQPSWDLPQERDRSSATSVGPPSRRKATCSGISSCTRGRSPSSALRSPPQI